MKQHELAYRLPFSEEIQELCNVSKEVALHSIRTAAQRIKHFNDRFDCTPHELGALYTGSQLGILQRLAHMYELQGEEIKESVPLGLVDKLEGPSGLATHIDPSRLFTSQGLTPTGIQAFGTLVMPFLQVVPNRYTDAALQSCIGYDDAQQIQYTTHGIFPAIKLIIEDRTA